MISQKNRLIYIVMRTNSTQIMTILELASSRDFSVVFTSTILILSTNHHLGVS